MTLSMEKVLCPYMVAIKQNVTEHLKLCGGTVLTHTLTLTAAHCLVHGIICLHLQFGSSNLFKGNIFEATRITFHPNFDFISLAHDIGLVSIFPAKVTFGYNIRPVVLPSKDMEINSNTFVKIYGWGAISDEKSFSESLQSAFLPVVNMDICQLLLNNIVPRSTFCLGYMDGHVDACLGDSGGPAMLHGKQVGIISFGEGCALPLKPGVYTDLRKYVDWLHRAMNILV